MWGANVRKYYEENILNDNPSGFLAFWVDVNYPYGARVFEHQIEGLLRVKEKKGAWSTFIRQMLLSDVKIIPHPSLEPTTYSYTDIVFEIFERNWNRSPRSGLKLVVYFDDDDERLSSEIKDEISSKLASALRNNWNPLTKAERKRVKTGRAFSVGGIFVRGVKPEIPIRRQTTLESRRPSQTS